MAGDDVAVAVAARRGAQRGEVRAGLRLGEALAEHEPARGDLGQEPLLGSADAWSNSAFPIVFTESR